MRQLLGDECLSVAAAGTQVFDDGSTLTTDDIGNVIYATDTDGNTYFPTGGQMYTVQDFGIVPYGCTVTGGTTTITQVAQTTTTTYGAATSGLTISTAISTPASVATGLSINFYCPPNFRR
jgi:hypothetical protein